MAKATRIWGWSLVRSRRLNSQGVLRRAELYSGFEAFHLSKCPTRRRRFKVLDNQNSRSVQTLRLFVGLEETCCNVSFRSFDPLSFNQFIRISYPIFPLIIIDMDIDTDFSEVGCFAIYYWQEASSDSGFDSTYTEDMESINSVNYAHQHWRNRRFVFTIGLLSQISWYLQQSVSIPERWEGAAPIGWIAVLHVCTFRGKCQSSFEETGHSD